MSTLGVMLVLALAHPPCLTDEQGPGAAVPAATPAVVLAPVAAPAVPPPPPPAALAQSERTRYRIDYGPLSVGELRLAIGAVAPGATVVRAGGEGAGGVLGLGRMRNTISTELDLTRLDSRRWVNARENDGLALTDHGEQLAAGHLTGVRVRARDHAPLQATLPGPLLDPIGFLLRLRIQPPRPGGATQILYVLDGQALWRLTVTSAGRSPLPDGTARVATVRLDAEAEPIHYDGSSDGSGDRHHRSLAFWLSDDANHVPLRVEMPLGPATVVVTLTAIERQPAPAMPVPGARSL